MKDSLFRLQIITPERIFYEEDVKMVVFKTSEGDIGVYKGHIPLTTTLLSGIVKINTETGIKKAALHGGFSEITPDKVTILTDAAEWPEEVDVTRAKKAKEAAEYKLRDREGDVDFARAEGALLRALARIDLVEYDDEE
ncbi:MAG: ATP synthase F1 subunit epsilon [Eubacteriales bacterium]